MSRKMWAIAAAAMLVAFVSGPAQARSLYYTVLVAEDAETGERFRGGAEGSISISRDGGTSFRELTRFGVRSSGIGFAYTRVLNHLEDDLPLTFSVAFGETEDGVPRDLIEETTVGEFKASLHQWRSSPWLTYRALPVSYGPSLDIVDTAIAAGDFTKLVAAVQTAGLEEALRGDGPFTVLAPTDGAFAALGLTDEQLLGLENLGDILLYHVVDGAVPASEVVTKDLIETLLGKDVVVTVDTNGVKVNDANIVLEDIEAANGIIHVIDAVLMPPALPDIVDTAIGAGIFSNLVAALEETGLDVALREPGPFTVFAPTDEAFEALGLEPADLLALSNLTDILLYHVVDDRLNAADVIAAERIRTLLDCDVEISVEDGHVYVNDAKVILADIKAENGIVHVIDAVLLPPDTLDIVDTAIDAGIFTTLVTALELTGLDEALREPGPFTVFAPTEEAFAKLPSWLLDRLLAKPDLLAQVLLYHVVSGDLDATEVTDSYRLKTLQGSSVYPRVRGDHVYINHSKVLLADVEAKNGTVHAIDRVLIPWWIWWQL